ncbi:hypothetical protein ACQP1U_13800 [Actinomycetota bacterium]
MASTSVRLLKIIGAAGVVGVAATGALAARKERQRRAVTPEEVRARLHERYAGLPPEDSGVTTRTVGGGRHAAERPSATGVVRAQASRARERLRGIPRRRKRASRRAQG